MPRCTCSAGRSQWGRHLIVAHPQPPRRTGESGERNEILANTTYFITKRHEVDLQQQNLNGVLPILYVFIVRADKSTTNVTSPRSTVTAHLRGRAGKERRHSRVRIRYTEINRHSQTLYYFTTDISDGGIKSTPGFLKFCERLGTGSSFSEVFFVSNVRNGFGTIRNFIFAHSRKNCQDDSGFPGLLRPKQMELRLFGTYLGPIDLFKQHYQPSLQNFLGEAIRPRSTSDSVIAGTTRKPI